MPVNFLFKPQYHLFGNRLFLVLAVDFLLLFCAEAILPGFVSQVFPLTWFLLMVLSLGMVMVALHIFAPAAVSARRGGLSRFLVIPLTILLALVGGIALFRVTLWQIMGYLILSLLSGKVLYRYLLR